MNDRFAFLDVAMRRLRWEVNYAGEERKPPYFDHDLPFFAATMLNEWQVQPFRPEDFRGGPRGMAVLAGGRKVHADLLVK
jgi:hypothetical protein